MSTDRVPTVWWVPPSAERPAGGLLWEHPHHGGVHDVRDVPMGEGVEPPADAVRLASTQVVASLIGGFQFEYVRALNAVLASSNDSSADAHRWRGHAEAYRQVCTKLRAAAGMEPVDMTSTEWRTAHGVYTAEDVAGFARRRLASRDPQAYLLDDSENH